MANLVIGKSEIYYFPFYSVLSLCRFSLHGLQTRYSEIGSGYLLITRYTLFQICLWDQQHSCTGIPCKNVRSANSWFPLPNLQKKTSGVKPDNLVKPLGQSQFILQFENCCSRKSAFLPVIINFTFKPMLLFSHPSHKS